MFAKSHIGSHELNNVFRRWYHKKGIHVDCVLMAVKGPVELLTSY